MLFNSFPFFLLVLLTFCIYYLPRLQKWQVSILVVASFVFYAWSDLSLLLLLCSSILINAITSFNIAQVAEKNKRLFWAVLGVICNLSILGLFKYGSLFTQLGLDILHTSEPSEGFGALILHLPLPIGISFYTFQGISLVIDVLREEEMSAGDISANQSVEPVNFRDYLLKTTFFISFFPQLVAGPIVKAKDFYYQIKPKYFQEIQWHFVFRYLVTGYFLKMVIADNLKDYTFWIDYPYYQRLGTVTNLVLLFGYSMQIFADFAGYSSIALGIAAAFGYKLLENFNFPYISRSITEFWRRWHISLSNWLRDYLYIPLGGNRKGKIRTYLNLIIVMSLGGLWHGAAWSYAVWGIFHGVGLAVERLLGINRKNKNSSSKTILSWQDWIADFLKVMGTFCFVSIGWLLFKLPEFSHAMDFIVTLVNNVNIKPRLAYIVPVMIFSLPVVLYHIPHFRPIQHLLSVQGTSTWQKKWWNLCTDIMFGIMLLLLFLNSGSANEFIYFQF
ncbi:MBOAT family O-acyltransferase [Laspinema olomoucense]|uniref:MBOAT family O-acyltransferase n=1 Tax=Laspinema olomoucense TaxID=3231600 RepID=UPI0021BB0592|nr:MBOAT family O-acyltransferase [Laspinema sp. D3a]MCT7989259.1 MBOAT family protein [Laspinema sp. D3a]